jgi:hypothetical protein
MYPKVYISDHILSTLVCYNSYSFELSGPGYKEEELLIRSIELPHRNQLKNRSQGQSFRESPPGGEMKILYYLMREFINQYNRS